MRAICVLMLSILFAAPAMADAADLRAAQIESSPSAPPQKGVSIGFCTGLGVLKGLHLWGPSSEDCNGLSEWGKYDSDIQAVARLGACKGHGAVEGVTLYGPPGKPCAGMADPAWTPYDAGVDVVRIGISSCLGHGDALEFHRLWGPTGARCGGMDDPAWGVYDEDRKMP